MRPKRRLPLKLCIRLPLRREKVKKIRIVSCHPWPDRQSRELTGIHLRCLGLWLDRLRYFRWRSTLFALGSWQSSPHPFSCEIWKGFLEKFLVDVFTLMTASIFLFCPPYVSRHWIFWETTATSFNRKFVLRKNSPPSSWLYLENSEMVSNNTV